MTIIAANRCGWLAFLQPPLVDAEKNTIDPCFILSLQTVCCAVLLLFAGHQLLILLFNNKYGPYRIKYAFESPFKLKSVGIVQLIKLNSLFLQLLISIVLYCISPANFAIFDIAVLLLLVVPFHIIEPTRSVISCASLLLYWTFKCGFNLVILIQDVFTDYKIHKADSLELNSFVIVLDIVLFINAVFIAIFEIAAYRPSSELIDYFEINQWSYLACHNFYSEIFFYWIQPTINLVYKKGTITIDQVPPVEISMSNVVAYENFRLRWAPALKRAIALRDEKLSNKLHPSDKDKELPKISLFWLLFKLHYKHLICIFIFQFLEILLSISRTWFLQKLILFFSETEITSNDKLQEKPIIIGLAIATALFMTSVLRFVAFNQSSAFAFSSRFAIQSQLSSAVYKKALNLSLESRKHKTTGEIVNNLSSDVFNVSDAPVSVIEMIISPMQILFALIALIRLLGKSTWTGILAAVILMPLNIKITTALDKLYEKNMENTDSRVRLTSEILTSIKSIKLYAWEQPLLKRLLHIRKDKELKLYRLIGIIGAFSQFLWECIPFVISCSSLIVFCYIADIPLVPSIVFPVLALFDVLAEPMIVVPYIFSGLVQKNVSFKRLRELLTLEESEKESVVRTYNPIGPNDTSIEVKNATFLWEHVDNATRVDASNIALENINFTARKGQLTCIVGRVGSGKTSLINGILGQLSALNKPETHISLNGTVAYCSQDPWIMNASVKDNILFGCKLDRIFYQMTIEACQLSEDLKLLPDGDRTIVGEKGISLSGGQKARLALARAVYSRADVIFLDDVLSAVDVHVCKKIVDRVLSKTGLLSSKTVVLATNAISVLKNADDIVLLKSGKITERGSFEEISVEGTELSALIKEFSAENTENAQSREDITTLNETPAVQDSTSETEETEFYPDVAETGNIVQERENNWSRRASLASFSRVDDDDEDEDNKDRKTGRLLETRATGGVKWEVFSEYFKACNFSYVSLYLLCALLAVVGGIASSYILKIWSELNLQTGKNTNVLFYLSLYSVVGISASFFTLLGTFTLWTYCCINGSIYFHDKMATAVLRSPMSFFETTPTGVILNRFSDDMKVIDNELAWHFEGFIHYALKGGGYLCVVAYNLPTMLVVIALLFIIYNEVRKYYIPASRELKRLNSASKSPLFSHLQESITGVNTIKAYNQEDRFIHKNSDYIDKLIKVSHSNNTCNRWLSMRLQTISSLIIFAAALLIVLSIGTKHQPSLGLVGFVMINALGVTGTLNGIIRYLSQIETESVAVERVIEYCYLTPEAETIVEDNRPPSNWPSKGIISIKNYSTKYRSNLDCVLKDISIDIKSGEKIGVVGRTGAGKSTLTLALFRILESCGGDIEIDNYDIGKLGLYDLRHNLNIIPQDSNAVEGSVRENLDPFAKYSDEKLLQVLELAHLKDHVLQMKTKRLPKDKQSQEEDGDVVFDTGLKAKIFEGGSNLSSGQRQLLSLSRALLNPSRILVLDEATAAVDVQTDKIIQQTIRRHFSDKTIVTIAHRLETILDSDRILVLDKGKVLEFDTPARLLENKSSAFYSLCQHGGQLKATGL